MKLKETSRFRKHYKTRIEGNRLLEYEYAEAIFMLLEDPFHESLNRHNLSYELILYESININFDYRVVFREVEEGYLFLDIGNHDQLYKTSLI